MKPIRAAGSFGSEKVTYFIRVELYRSGDGARPDDAVLGERRRSTSARQRQRKPRAAAGSILRAHLAPVQFHEMLDDRQPEPGAAGVAGARLVHPVKPLEDARQVRFGN